MASRLGACSPAPYLTQLKHKYPLVLPLEQVVNNHRRRARRKVALKIRVSDGGESYLEMWKNAVDRERKSIEFQRIAENSSGVDAGDPIIEELDKKNEEFKKILEVSKEERDRVQRMQVIDRAAAAIAAARAIIDEKESTQPSDSGDSGIYSDDSLIGEDSKGMSSNLKGIQSGSTVAAGSDLSGKGTPGPDFWLWIPPPDNDQNPNGVNKLQKAQLTTDYKTLANPVIEKEQSVGFLSIPLDSKLSESNHSPLLPPLQSLMEIDKVEASKSGLETPSLDEDHEVEVQFSAYAAEAVHALDNVEEALSKGVSPDGSRWWKETGVERRPDGVICRWTLTRGVSADQVIEWQDKFWEAADEFGYKELGSEKSGRDASGNVWREFWRESMRQENGLVFLEKTADKWGKNGQGGEWQERWWEQYNASGQSEKWAHKWCSIDPNTYLEAGHAHVWHERWGEKYDGRGGSTKYTDKWAERCEGVGWTKWGDKWDENFDPNANGVKQGETWWEGKHGERWNRTWGEHHNGSGWVHKYGESSSGEHWDTHEQQETWYERFPHYGFYHCYDNSVQLREVPNPSEMT